MAREEVMDSHEQVILQYTDGVEEKLRQYRERYSDCEQYDYSENIGSRRIQTPIRAAGESARKLSNHSCWNEKPRSTAAWSILRSPKTRSTGQRASMLKEAAREGWFQKKNATQDGIGICILRRAAGKSDGDRQDDPEYRRQQL